MPETLWGATTPSAAQNLGGNASIGTRIKSAVDGNVTGVRFWGASGFSLSAVLVKLWSDAGVELASKSAAGINPANQYYEYLFDTPVPITAETFYRCSATVRLRPNLTNAFAAGNVVNGNLTGTTSYWDAVGAFPASSSETLGHLVDFIFQAAGGAGGVRPIINTQLDSIINPDGIVAPGLISQ